MKLEGKVTILFSRDGLKIEVEDKLSSLRFLEVSLDQHQTCDALSRLACTPCVIDVRGLDNVGKQRENGSIEFELPPSTDFHNRKEIASVLAKEHCPDGWIVSTYFGSQDSFFKKDGKPYARTSTTRWVEVDRGNKP
jgi:hypothetical protein